MVTGILKGYKFERLSFLLCLILHPLIPLFIPITEDDRKARGLSPAAPRPLKIKIEKQNINFVHTKTSNVRYYTSTRGHNMPMLNKQVHPHL